MTGLYKVNVVETQGYVVFVIADSHEGAKERVSKAVAAMSCADMVANIEGYSEDQVNELGIENIEYVHKTTQVMGSELISEEYKVENE